MKDRAARFILLLGGAILVLALVLVLIVLMPEIYRQIELTRAIGVQSGVRAESKTVSLPIRVKTDSQERQEEPKAKAVTEKDETPRAELERQARFEEVGKYSGRAYFWHVGGVRLTVRESDVLRDRLLIPIEVMSDNPDVDLRLRVTLFNEDGTELVCQKVRHHEGNVQTQDDCTITAPPSGERGLVVLEFARKNASGRFALAVNGLVIFRPTHYGWKFEPL